MIMSYYRNFQSLRSSYTKTPIPCPISLDQGASEQFGRNFLQKVFLWGGEGGPCTINSVKRSYARLPQHM